MKRSMIILVVSVLFLGLGCLAQFSVFEVTIETPTPLASSAPVSSPDGSVAVISENPAAIASPVESQDPYGALYFSIIKEKEYPAPATPPPGLDESVTRLARLPGSCVVGLLPCPAPEVVPTPFDMKDVLATDSDAGALAWSPDGRFGLLVIHPQDDITRGEPTDSWEDIKKKDLKDLEISPSVLYLFDAENETWRELYRAERKFFHSPRWSRDGQWVAFNVASSLFSFHPFQADDGVYIVRPDGSDLKQLGGNGNILGWVGENILLVRNLKPGSSTDFSHVVEKLGFDGQLTTLFELSYRVRYALAPDGSSLLTVDGPARAGGSPQITVNLLALDGSVIRSFGTFSNNTPAYFPAVWSPDGSWVAFANLRRLLIGPRAGRFLTAGDTFGFAPDIREVYVADDQSISPDFLDVQFSPDNKYLLAEVYEGSPHFVVVSLDNGSSTSPVIPHLDPFVVDEEYLGVPSFFSWRQ